MKPATCCLLTACYLLFITDAVAHEARPIFIQIHEITSRQFSVHTKVPTTVPEYALPVLTMPDGCQERNTVIKVLYPDAYITQQLYDCRHGITGLPLRLVFPVFNPSISSLFRVELLSGEIHSHIMKPGESSWSVPEQASVPGVAREYLILGIRHIFAGIDHLLFIACLIIIGRTGRRILLTLTGFTLAHSLTLALSTLRLVELPVPPVEAMIALSIVFLAHEIAADNRQSWSWRYPVAVSSCFGLLHGFGFAAVLRAIGLPQTELPAALLFFNLGVELGQILFVCMVALVFLALQLPRIHEFFTRQQQPITPLAAYLIGTIASFWFVQRVAGFWQ